MGYDGLDRLQNTSWWNSPTSQTLFLTITYDSAGRRTSTNQASSFTFYGYDAVSRLTSLAQQMNGVDSPQPANATVTQTFAFNPANQVVQKMTSNNAFVYTGNVSINRPYSVNGLNQYTSAGSAAFTYDANGNLTGDGSTTYVYDIENRLVTASGAHTASIRYDPLGRLYEVAGSSGTTRFLYDGDAMIGEYAAGGTQLQRYAWGAGPDDLVLWDQGSALNCSGTSFAARDNQGSIIAWANCGGNQSAINTYDEYGIPGSANTGRFQYTGQAWVPELGMYYYKARMYSPTLGRFMQTDLIGYKDQMNLYAYVGNDPANGIDSSGMADDPDGPCGQKYAGSCSILAGSGQSQLIAMDSTVTLMPESGESDDDGNATNLGGDGSAQTGSLPQESSGIVVTAINKRKLSSAEIGFYRSYGYPEKVLEGVTLHQGLPWYVFRKDVNGITPGAKDIYLDDISSALSSPGQAGLIGHELYHAWEYYIGTISQSEYVGKTAVTGYHNSPYEIRARQWQRFVISGYCQRLGC